MEVMGLATELKSERYNTDLIDLENKNDSRSLVIEFTGSDKEVLEIGTSTGYITKILKERGNRIIGVEIDKAAGEMAKLYCESMIIGDVETLDLDSYIGPASIDVILLADVLEHLKRPGDLLGKIKKYLKPDGYLVVSIPNISHGDVLLNLLNGDFRYTSVGLLDETHLRFFGRRNILDIFNKYKYSIKDIKCTKVPIGSTELKLNLSKMPTELIAFIKALPDSDVYQFIFRALPSENPSNEAIPNVDFDETFNASIEDVTSQYKSQISALEQEISEVHRSLVWRAATKFQNDFIEKGLPGGTRRRKIYDRCLECCKNLVSKDGML